MWSLAQRPHFFVGVAPTTTNVPGRDRRAARLRRGDARPRGARQVADLAGPLAFGSAQRRAARAQVQAYSGSSARRAAGPRPSGRNVSIITAVSSVVVLPSASPATAASTAPGCGPWVNPEGCSVIEPSPTPEPFRAV